MILAPSRLIDSGRVLPCYLLCMDGWRKQEALALKTRVNAILRQPCTGEYR